MSAPTWLAHTQYHFSRLLTLRGETEDVELAAELLDSALRISVDLGMRGLESRIKSGTGDG
jgi:hypothetical protein